MYYALDLTRRQARRVLEQALRSHARLEIEPHHWRDDDPIAGGLRAIDDNLLSVDLDDDGRELAAPRLVGAFCDVRTVLSDQMYFFGTCILQVQDDAVPRRLVLAMPESVQVGNRRRFHRRALPPSALVRLCVGGRSEGVSAELCNASGNGLACRVGRDLDADLLIGDPVRVRFQLPGLAESFDLAATVCNKTPSGDRNGLIVGLQFNLEENDTSQTRAVERLRSFLCNAPLASAEPEKGP